jgi:FtsH-binding integral membrane protein
MSLPPKYSEMDPLWSNPTNDEFKMMENKERHRFILKVYSILFVMITTTFIINAIFFVSSSAKEWLQYGNNTIVIFIPCTIGLFVIIFLMICIPTCRYVSPHNYICLTLFTLFMSFILVPATTTYNTNIVLLAFGATMFITLGLTLFSVQTKWDFTGIGPYLSVVLFGLLFLGFIQIFVHDQVLNTVYSSIGAILFSFYIVYDTQLIVGGDHKNKIGTEEYIFAALSLYLDIINLFISLLELMGDR